MSVEHTLGAAETILPGGHDVFTVAGRQIGVFNIDGDYFALANACFHQNGPLCRGTVSGTVVADAETGWRREWSLDGEVVVCPWHSLEFNIKTGACLAYPRRRVPTYPVRVDDGVLKVTL
jgi:nitrite reductase (NADH) small subunit